VGRACRCFATPGSRIPIRPAWPAL